MPPRKFSLYLKQAPFTLLAVGLLGALIFTACSGSQTASSIPSIAGNSNAPSFPALSTTHGFAKPWTRLSGYTPAKVGGMIEGNPSLPQDSRALPNFLSSRKNTGVRTPDGEVSSKDGGGDAELLIPAATTTGIWDAISVYEAAGAGTLSPQYVDFSTTYNHLLYAPTTLPPNNGCIEFGIQYDNVGTLQQAFFYAADWCNGAVPYTNSKGQQVYKPTMYRTPITDQFYQTYVRVFSNGDGDPEMQVEEKLELDGNWHLLAFDEDPPCTSAQCVDPHGQQYVQLYQTPNSTNYAPPYVPSEGYPAGEGWNIFETHYNLDGNGSDCPSLPRISASGLRSQYGLGSSIWQYTPVSQLFEPTQSDGTLGCFDTSVPANLFSTYDALYNSDVGWWVEQAFAQASAPLPINDNRYPAWPDKIPVPRITPPPCLNKCWRV